MSCVFFAWFGLAANFTVIGSDAPGGFCPFRFLTASSASARLSNRMKATPRDMPVYREQLVTTYSDTRSRYFWQTNVPFENFWKARKSITCRTCSLVNKYTRVNDVSITWKHVLHILLGHGLWQAANIQVGIFYCIRAGSRVWHLATGSNTCLFKTRLILTKIVNK